MDLEDDEEDLENVSDEERRAAEALARSLEPDASGDESGAELGELALRIRAIKGEPAPLAAQVQQDAVAQALAVGTQRRRRRSALPYLAAAAALLVAVTTGALASGAFERPADPLRYGGPTSPLFSSGFEDAQTASARLDRITRARSRDYFAALAQRAGAEP